MKETTEKRTLMRRLLQAISQSSQAMISTYSIGISPLEAYAFLDQKGLFAPEQSYVARFRTLTMGGQNDTNAG
jgi:hypothetical protein